MRTLILNLALFAALVGCSATFNGCATVNNASPTVQVLNSIEAVQITVDNAMTGYGDAVTAGLIDVSDRRKVRDFYRQYEEIENAAILSLGVAVSLGSEPSPIELSDAAFNLIILIGTLVN